MSTPPPNPPSYPPASQPPYRVGPGPLGPAPAPRKAKWYTSKWVVWVGIFILGAAFGNLTAGRRNSTSAATSHPTATATAPMAASTSATVPTEASSFIDGVLTTPEKNIVITDHKVIPVGKTGNEYGSKPVIAFWYRITNQTDRHLDPNIGFILAITAYQDNNPNAENKLQVAGSSGSRV